MLHLIGPWKMALDMIGQRERVLRSSYWSVEQPVAFDWSMEGGAPSDWSVKERAHAQDETAGRKSYGREEVVPGKLRHPEET